MIFYLVIFIGILAVSLAATLIKLCAAPAMVIATYRMLIASAFFVATGLVRRVNPLARFSKRDFLLAATSGLFLCLHFGTWITSLQYISVANSVVLIATTPVFVGLGAIIFLKEKPTKFLLTGILFTTLGTVIVSFQGLVAATENALLGNVLALIGAFGAAGYYLLGRELRARINTFSYVTVVYSITALFLLLITLQMELPLTGYGGDIYLLLFLIAFVPQVIGHTSFNWALQHVSAATVAVISLGEPLAAPVLAFFILGEEMTTIQLMGGLSILTGVIFALRGEFLQSTAAKSFG